MITTRDRPILKMRMPRLCSMLRSGRLSVSKTAGVEAMTTFDAGGIEYGALRQSGRPALTVAWRSRVSPAGRWFTCGELVPEGAMFAVRGWDGEPIGQAASVHAGLDAVRAFYTRIALGSAEAQRRRNTGP